MMENLTMIDRLESFHQLTQGPTRTWTPAENQEMLDIVKWFMRISFGIKTRDGAFDQDEPAGSGEVWKRFRITEAYNTFLMSLFRTDPMKAVEFMMRVTPDTLVQEQLNTLDPEVRRTYEKMREKDQKADRLPPGTRIIDDVPQVAPSLQAVPDAPAEDVDPDFDYDSLLNEPAKRPIKQSEYDFMKGRVSEKQFEHFMSTRYVSDEA
jgi:hypothetical protein